MPFQDIISPNTEINTGERVEIEAITRAKTTAREAENGSDVDSDCDEAHTTSLEPVLDKDKIKVYQQGDPRLRYVYSYLSRGTLPGDPKLTRNTLTMAPDFSIVDGFL